MLVKFGDQVRIAREEKGLSQEAAAKAIRDIYNVRLSSAYLSMIERGERQNLTKKLESAICEFFNIKPLDNISSTGLPILGTIRAGVPILAQESYDGYLDVPESIRADFVLRVTGDSMIGAGILEGDYAICRESEEPQTGQIVVALKDEGSTSEATLKFYFNGSGDPKLKPANPNYPEYDYKKDKYRCAGHMVALIREDSPGYQTYKEYITVAGHEEWTEVIDIASGYGLSPREVINILEAQWSMIQKLKGQ